MARDETRIAGWRSTLTPDRERGGERWEKPLSRGEDDVLQIITNDNIIREDRLNI